MSQKKKLILAVVGAVLFIGLVVGAYFGYKELAKRESPGGGADVTIKDKGNYADFTVIDKDGNEHKLSDFIGKPIVINFWASWCSPCKAELPHFDALCKEYEGRVTFLMVNLLSGETRESVVEFVKQKGYAFPLYFDNMRRGAQAYSVSSIPVTVFITAEGNIGEQRVGAMSEATLRSYIDKLLKKEND